MSPKKIKIVTIIGARPQFIKAVPISRAIEKHNIENKKPEIKEIVVHTGQHYDLNMSQIFFDQLEIPEPKYHLKTGSGSHGQMTGRMLTKIENVLHKENPDWVLVYGDTNSTLAGALAAVKLHIPVAHVEAGLRSFNRRMPEEINRVVTDHISNLLFCPTETAVNNLRREGFKNVLNTTNSTNLINIDNPLILNVGDVMFDAFLVFKNQALEKSRILLNLGLRSESYCLATVHRQENTDDPTRLYNIFSAFEKLACKECPFIIPLHPRTRKIIKKSKFDIDKNPYVKIVMPVNYLDIVALECSSRVILTDSGGIQKEAYFAKVPCITLRDETEWVETVESGWNYLAGTDTQSIIKAFNTVTKSELNVPPNLFGDGNASTHILRHLISSFPN